MSQHIWSRWILNRVSGNLDPVCAVRYWGVDSSERAVDSAGRELGDINLWSFHVMDYLHDDLPRADLLVSRAALLVSSPRKMPVHIL